MNHPKLSICVPSRNRQTYFQQTIADLIANPRGDIEFVLADNSDDPSIMNGFMAGIADERVRYLPSTGTVLAMQDNWERVMAETRGDWIVFIGDDDYVDPDVIDTVTEISRRHPDTESVGWNRMSYKWPSFRPFPGNLCVSLKSEVRVADRATLMRQMFLWAGATHVPSAPFTIYHGAVARPAMERIRKLFCGRYFEHPTVDFDCSFKLITSARGFAYVSRPFSVLGASENSNSSAVGRFDKARELYGNFVAEDGERFEAGEEMTGFPFKSRLGVACSILSAQHWFKHKYNVRLDGWEENFAKALARDCGQATDRESFEAHVTLCRSAFSTWKDGKYLSAFAPRFVGRSGAGLFTGLRGTNLFIDENIADVTTPAALYGLVQGMLPDVGQIDFSGLEPLAQTG